MIGEPLTIPGVYAAKSPKVGDTFTIAGIKARIPNPDRRWWQLWRPRWIETELPQTFRVVAKSSIA